MVSERAKKERGCVFRSDNNYGVSLFVKIEGGVRQESEDGKVWSYQYQTCLVYMVEF